MKPRERYGHLVLVARLPREPGKMPSESRWVCSCAACGAVHTLTPIAIYAARRLDRKACIKCRWKIHHAVVQCAEPGCSQTFAVPANGATGQTCAKHRKERLRRRYAARTLRHALKTRGRVCSACKRTDAETRWSPSAALCAACERRKARMKAQGRPFVPRPVRTRRPKQG